MMQVHLAYPVIPACERCSRRLGAVVKAAGWSVLKLAGWHCPVSCFGNCAMIWVRTDSKGPLSRLTHPSPGGAKSATTQSHPFILQLEHGTHPKETSHRVFLLRHLAQARGAFFRRLAEGFESLPLLCLFSSLSIRSKPGGHTRVFSQRHVLLIQDEALSKDLSMNNAEKLGAVSLPNDGRGVLSHGRD